MWPQKSAKFILYKIACKVPGSWLFNILAIQKSNFIPFLFIPTKKIWQWYRLACFHQDQKCQNRVKISNFLTLSRITRKVIIKEQWTKTIKNLVLSNEYTKKKLLKSVKIYRALWPAEVRPSAHEGWITKKKSPHNTPWFLEAVSSTFRPIEYIFTFSENCSPPKKMAVKKRRWYFLYIFLCPFLTGTNFSSKIFF